MLHALMCQGRLIGLYSDYEQCTQTLEGLVQNRFVVRNNINIKSYYENSMMTGRYDVECGNNMNTKNVVVKNDISEDETTMSESDLDTETRKKVEDERKKRTDLQYELIKAKKEKERLEESQRTFEVDIDLYHRFKKVLVKNPSFEIPELFQDKYPLMERLEHDNMLNWENFHKHYQPKKIETGYTNMFNSVPVNVPVNGTFTEKTLLTNIHNNLSETETETEDEDVE